MADIRVISINPGPQARIDTRRLQLDVLALMRDTVANGNRFIARYPAQKLRKTRYRRTNTLKRSWSFRVQSRGKDISGEVGSNSNIAPYNQWVQGRRRQRRIFRQAGWKNVNDLADKMVDEFNDGLDKIIQEHTQR